MYFRFATVVALLSAAIFAIAQSSDGPNPFKIPTGGWQVTAGQSITLNWTPTTDSTISLILRHGAMSDLSPGVQIASGLQNSGSYTWTPASDLPRRSDYAIEIVDDSNSSEVNYSPPFIVDSTNVIQTSSSMSASGSSSTGTSTMTGSSSSSSGGSTKTKTGTMTGSSSSMATGSTTQLMGTNTAGGQSTGASFQPTAASSSGNSAARATAMAGMLGAVALGALAL